MKNFGELSEINVESFCDGFRLTATDTQGNRISEHIDQEEDMGYAVFDFFKSIGITTTHEEVY